MPSKKSGQQYAADNGYCWQPTSAWQRIRRMITWAKERHDAGAQVVIGYGEEFRSAPYMMQKKYKKSNLIILDGAPCARKRRQGEITKEHSCDRL